jgi:hypothetical protein
MADRPAPLIPTEIEITPEMIEAGLGAWCKGSGDEYPEHSICNDLTVIDIYRAMREAVKPTLIDNTNL